MKTIFLLIRRTLPILLCLMLLTTASLAEGVHFSIRADMDPVQYPASFRQLMTGLAKLLDAARLEGELVVNGGSFDAAATLHIGSGEDECVTDVRLYGLSSHWGMTSSLLGDTPLMVNCASLLPFGEKAREYTGLPLDAAALLVPYVHQEALAPVISLLSPLFPAENGSLTLTRSELDAMAAELRRLSDEHAAFNRWLNVTGLYSTLMRWCRLYDAVPALLLPGVTVERTDDSLTWTSGLLTLLSLKQQENTTTLSISIPTQAEVSATLRNDHTFVTGAMHLDVGSTKADLSFSLPTTLPCVLPSFYLTLDAESPLLPGDELHLFFEGESRGNTLTIRQLLPMHTYTMLEITATLTPITPAALPDYTPSDLNGVDVLSINSDSLAQLMKDVQRPLLSGLYDLLVALPPETVQTMMDVLEDAGVIDLLTDSLTGY